MRGGVWARRNSRILAGRKDGTRRRARATLHPQIWRIPLGAVRQSIASLGRHELEQNFDWAALDSNQ